jgi:sulfur carrier protein ThiS
VKVTAHLHTTLQRQTPEGLIRRLDLQLPGNSRVNDLLALLEIKFPPESLMLAVNGRVADADQILEDGDQVNIMPAISGGSSS